MSAKGVECKGHFGHNADRLPQCLQAPDAKPDSGLVIDVL